MKKSQAGHSMCPKTVAQASDIMEEEDEDYL